MVELKANSTALIISDLETAFSSNSTADMLSTLLKLKPEMDTEAELQLDEDSGFSLAEFIWNAFIGIRMTQSAMATLANLLTLVSVARFKSLRTSTNIIVSSIATSDFLHGLVLLVTLPLRHFMEFTTFVTRWICMLGLSMELATVYMQFISFALLAIDRWNSLRSKVNKNTRRWSLRSFVILVVVGWVLVITWTAALIALQKDEPSGLTCTLPNNFPRYYVHVTVACFAITTSIIVGFYSSIAAIAIASNRKVTPGPVQSAFTNQPEMPNPHALQLSQRRKSDMRITRMMALLVGIFFLLYFPYAVSIQLLTKSTHEGGAAVWQLVLHRLTIVLLDINFWINPAIYAWRNPRYRAAFKKILQPCCSFRSNE